MSENQTNKVSPSKKSDLRPIRLIDPTVHSPARMMVLVYLSSVDWADFTVLLDQTGLTRGNLSSHLSHLEEVGYVRIEKKFEQKIPRTWVRITEKGSSALQDYKQTMRKILRNM